MFDIKAWRIWLKYFRIFFIFFKLKLSEGTRDSRHDKQSITVNHKKRQELYLYTKSCADALNKTNGEKNSGYLSHRRP